MGYCWTSGRKENDKWKFTKCNGNKSKGPNNCYPEAPLEIENPRCRDCVEWCKTKKEAITIVEDWERLNK